VPGDVHCKDNGTCIHADMVCNGISDCMDGSDETNCGMIPIILKYFFLQYDRHAYMLSRHTAVCSAAQENGARTNRVSISTGTTNLSLSRICSSVMPNPDGTKFTVEVPSTQGRQLLKFE